MILRDVVAQEFSEDETYKEVEDLEAKLLQYKSKSMHDYVDSALIC